MSLVGILTGIAIGCWAAGALTAAIVLIADWIPAPARTAAAYDGQVTWIDPPTGSIPIVKSDVVIDLEARARRTQRAGEAQTRRREGLRRHLNALLSAADEVRQQLRANGEALTQPTPILDEQPTGGER